jgi:hypothetical protein
MAVFLRPSRSVLRIAEGAAAARVAYPARATSHAPAELVRSTTAGCAEELERLTKLHNAGALTEAEFGAAKSRLLGL